MNRPHYICCVVCLMIATAIVSCKPGIPSEYIQRHDMEHILYDYHVAQALLINDPSANTPENQQKYKLAVLKKHGVTEQQFERSMEYYMRHTEILYDLYENLEKRFERSAVEYGITVNDIDQYGTSVAKGDTTDIWGGERSIMLSNHKPFHLRSFSIPADTTFKAGDKITLNFDTQFIIQEGSRDGIVVLAIRFANDSVASSLQRVSSNQHYAMQVHDSNFLGIKGISGYFLLNKPLSEKSSTLKLLALNNIRMVRLHTKKPKEQPSEGRDSVNGETVPNESPISPGRISMGFSRMKK